MNRLEGAKKLAPSEKQLRSASASFTNRVDTKNQFSYFLFKVNLEVFQYKLHTSFYIK